ncbi:MAG: hypothetical protein K8F91_14680 [Candidatus Obscuribacterales bacterium]|nr:hypothetical protein [Candidatus Obscuribacterales bacterium]
MEKTTEHLRLGDLLLKAEIITSGYIQEALGNFEQQGLPLGKVLVVSGYLNDAQLRAALDLQYMVNDGLLDTKDAVSVLKICHQSSIPLADAFEAANIVQPEEKDTNKLGQLLTESGVLTATLLFECLSTNQKTALPLGHIVCHRGYASQALIDRTLLVQQLIRKGQLMRKQGINSLKVAFEREKTLMQLEINRGYRFMPLKKTPLLGDLLLEAKILPERQIRQCLIESIVNDTTLGKTLIDAAGLSRQLVDAAVELQESLDNATLNLEEALICLKEIKISQVSSVQAMAEVATAKHKDNKASDLIELLLASGIIKKTQIPDDMQDRLAVNYNQLAPVIKGLLDLNIVEKPVLYSALRAVDLIDRKTISQEKAIVALDFSARSKNDIEYTLYMTGVTSRTRLKELERRLAE